MNDEQLEKIRAQHKRIKRKCDMSARHDLPRHVVDDIGALLDLVDELQTKLNTLLPAAQQASSLLEAIQKDTLWMVSLGVRELYQVIDEDLVAALEAVTK